MNLDKKSSRLRRAKRTRAKIKQLGAARLSVHRTSKHMYAQVIDAEGNLFVTSDAGVEVFAPDGTLWGVIEIPEQATNCTFGGPDNNTLFVTGATGLYSVELQ